MENKDWKPKGNKIGETLWIYTKTGGWEGVMGKTIEYNPMSTFSEYLKEKGEQANDYDIILAACTQCKEEQEYFHHIGKFLIKEFKKPDTISTIYWNEVKVPELLLNKIKI